MPDRHRTLNAVKRDTAAMRLQLDGLAGHMKRLQRDKDHAQRSLDEIRAMILAEVGRGMLGWTNITPAMSTIAMVMAILRPRSTDRKE